MRARWTLPHGSLPTITQKEIAVSALAENKFFVKNTTTGKVRPAESFPLPPTVFDEQTGCHLVGVPATPPPNVQSILDTTTDTFVLIATNINSAIDAKFVISDHQPPADQLNRSLSTEGNYQYTDKLFGSTVKRPLQFRNYVK